MNKKQLLHILEHYEHELNNLQTVIDCRVNEIEYLRSENKKLISLLFQVTKSDERD